MYWLWFHLRGFYFIFYEKPGGNTHNKKINGCYCFCGLLSYLRVSWGSKTGEVYRRTVQWQLGIVSLVSLTAGYSSASAYLPLVVGI